MTRTTTGELVAAAREAGSAALSHVENTDLTRRAGEWARGAGLWIEAELGYVGGKPESPASAHADGLRTDPGEARAFVDATGVDAPAVAVGSSHAMTTRTAVLDHRLIADLAAAVPVPLVLHGSSGVEPGGLRTAVAAGMRKINVGTAVNVAYTAAVRAALAADPAVVDPRRHLAPACDAIAAAVVRDLLLGVLPGTGGTPRDGSGRSRDGSAQV